MQSNTEYKPEWIREDFIDFIAEKFDSIWAWKRIKAEIIDVQALSSDFIQLQLRPNQNFKVQDYQAGQSILLTALIGGVRHQRSYSIVDISDQGQIAVAVKKQGAVSNALTALRPGAVVEISQPQGEFVLKPLAKARLLLASGSGITAIYALLAAHLRQSQKPIDLIYFTRDGAYAAEIQALAAQHPYFKFHLINTLQQKLHADAALLEQRVPDFKSRDCYACGASAMMQSVQQLYAQLDLTEQLHTEYFQIPADESLASQPVKFLRAQREFQAKSNLLESAELAGLKPTHGCRMGICNSCSCTKVQGSVKNMLTGEIDSRNNAQIKLCISQAISPVVINL
ncbi:ferredoxin reductase [Acinetobacter sp. WCHAc010034]|uniref:ferredoxin reductase n=1 Tax=Acinetobacter sp. WCHAc010034 TaxID=1879049 RepID=UPI00083AF864|nr:ferredoxin reductase [Acinetobacter sp. WCHAc010034]AYA01834.1 ferredoxin reductase [Acinetobacter sp. WCHAc010034]